MKAPTQALLPPVAHAVIRQPLGQCFALGIWIDPATREAPDVHHRGYARVVQELAEILAGQPPVSHSQQFHPNSPSGHHGSGGPGRLLRWQRRRFGGRSSCTISTSPAPAIHRGGWILAGGKGNPMDIVIVGGGLAGGQTARALRAAGHTGGISLIAAEAHVPYERPPLSKKYLAGEVTFETAWVRPAAWYREHDVDLRLNTTATAVDRDRQQVTL